MSDHREKDIESKKLRGLSRRAQLRRMHKALKMQQLVTEHFCNATKRAHDEIKELRRRLDETQKLLPFWIRKFP